MSLKKALIKAAACTLMPLSAFAAGRQAEPPVPFFNVANYHFDTGRNGLRVYPTGIVFTGAYRDQNGNEADFTLHCGQTAGRSQADVRTRAVKLAPVKRDLDMDHLHVAPFGGFNFINISDLNRNTTVAYLNSSLPEKGAMAIDVLPKKGDVRSVIGQAALSTMKDTQGRTLTLVDPTASQSWKDYTPLFSKQQMKMAANTLHGLCEMVYPTDSFADGWTADIAQTDASAFKRHLESVTMTALNNAADADQKEKSPTLVPAKERNEKPVRKDDKRAARADNTRTSRPITMTKRADGSVSHNTRTPMNFEAKSLYPQTPQERSTRGIKPPLAFGQQQLGAQ